MTDKVKIVFTPSGIRGEVDKGTDILTAARTLGADLDTVCGGNGVCGRCKIQISEGEFTKHQITSKGTHLSKLTTADIELFPSTKLSQGFRLGCRAKIMADVVVDIPPESQVHQQVVRKEAAALTIETKPAVKLYTVDVAEPQLDSSTGDLERLREAIEFEAGLQNLTFDFSILPVMQSVLRKGKWQVTLAVYADTRVIAIWPGEQTQRYGIAVDIGSTTLAGHLCDLNTGDVLASSGLMNPQIRFGEDVMSRVSYAMMNAGGDVEMTQAVRDGINAVIEDLLLQAKLEVEHVLDIVCVANPIMHHLILGIDPVELGGAPFALATQASLNLAARDLNLSLAKGARLYMLPCIAGHVGADAAAVALSEAPYKQEAITLIIDVGTNAEIILGNKDKCVSASAPTGPAFEGAQIEHGQRAAPGAIEKVRIDPITLEPKFKVIGIEEWSDEASFPEQAKKTGVTGICGSGIIEAIATLFLAGVIQADGVMNGAQAAQSSRIIKNDKTWAYELVQANEFFGQRILITQNDVRAIQLAKSTLYASAKLLMDKLGVNHIERIRFAGAFGAHIDPKYAMVLGMIPDCPLDEVQAVGNAAGTGARIALLSEAARSEIETEVQRLEKIETAIEASFQDYFIAAMMIPHQSDAFPNLSQVVDLPVVSASAGASRSRRKRRSSRGGKPNISR